IESSTQYKERYKEDLRLPSSPKDYYAHKRWVHWGDFFGFEMCPEGWMNINQVSRINSIKSSQTTIANFVSSYREVNPDWFKRFWSETTQGCSECLSPELIKLIKTNFGSKRLKFAPK